MGLVLVFDMDQTILDSSDPYLFNRPPGNNAYKTERMIHTIKQSLNWNIVNIMKRAAKLRPSGQVSAICLLTNNSSNILVSAVDNVLYEEISSTGKYRVAANNKEMPNKPYFFDYIMMRQHTSRPITVNDNPPKRLKDILNMLDYIGIKNEGVDTLKDIFFFDDLEAHEIRGEFAKYSNGDYSNHYIQITPPYSRTARDNTRYDSILEALSKLDKEPPTLPPLEVKVTPQIQGLRPGYRSPHTLYNPNIVSGGGPFRKRSRRKTIKKKKKSRK
jgi:hypothetical protein